MVIRNLVATLIAASSVVPCAARAEGLGEALGRVLEEHALAAVVRNDVAAASSQLGVERSAWLPRLSLRADSGYQDISRDVGASGSYHPATATVGLSQLLWDFGATNRAIDRAHRNLDKEEAERDAQLQNLLLAGIESHLQLLRAQLELEFAQQSEANVLRQSGMEDQRIQAGAGLTTDLLQAETQLAGARARRVLAESQVRIAESRFRAVFGGDEVPQALEAVAVPETFLPGSLEAALAAIEERNVDVAAARARAALVDAERSAIRARELMPRVELLLERSQKEEYDGFTGGRDDTRAVVQFHWKFDTGLGGLRSIDVARYSAAAEREKARYVQVQATEEVRNAWSDLQAARERARILAEQAGLAQRFLELARRERELGRRSLLDVLNGETNLINARSDAAAAATDVALTSFRLLRATGDLKLSAVITEQRPTARAALSDIGTFAAR